MSTTNDTRNQIHHGRNVKRFREMFGIKQEALAELLGDDWSQKKVSILEAKEIIEPELLEQVAKALKVPADAIKSFSEETAVNIIANTVTNNDQSASVHYTFNPIDKIVERYDSEIKTLKEEIQFLRSQNKQLLDSLSKK